MELVDNVRVPLGYVTVKTVSDTFASQLCQAGGENPWRP